MKTVFFLVFVVFIITSCGGPKVLVDYRENAEQAELTGNHEQAVVAWQNYFDKAKNAEIEGAVYARAAKAAYKAGMNQQAIDWFDQARYKDYADEEMYLIQAEIFESLENISKELGALEFYVDNFEKDNAGVNKRLFEIYNEIGMREKALKSWNRINPDSINSVNFLEKYFVIQKKLDNKEIADSVSLELLEMDPNHVGALEWNAMKYYWKAENRYQREMKKYEQNHTRAQYRKLLKQLDIVTTDFKRALTYFERLWELEPGKKYAPFIANIYTRFNQDDKAAYYKKYVE